MSPEGDDRATVTIVTTYDEAARLVSGDMPHEEFERLIEREVERARDDDEPTERPDDAQADTDSAA